MKHRRFCVCVFRSDQQFPAITRKKGIKEELEDKACGRLSPAGGEVADEGKKGQIKRGIRRRGEEQTLGLPSRDGRAGRSSEQRQEPFREDGDGLSTATGSRAVGGEHPGGYRRAGGLPTQRGRRPLGAQRAMPALGSDATAE